MEDKQVAAGPCHSGPKRQPSYGLQCPLPALGQNAALIMTPVRAATGWWGQAQGLAELHKHGEGAACMLGRWPGQRPCRKNVSFPNNRSSRSFNKARVTSQFSPSKNLVFQHL